MLRANLERVCVSMFRSEITAELRLARSRCVILEEWGLCYAIPHVDAPGGKWAQIEPPRVMLRAACAGQHASMVLTRALPTADCFVRTSAVDSRHSIP